MTYYDFDLAGTYQSEERALSFIHAVKEVLADYDSTPNLADEWRCLIPFNYNGTTRYYGHVLMQSRGKVGICSTHGGSYTYLRNSITDPEATVAFESSVRITGDNPYKYMYPLKYIRIYKLDNGKLFYWFTTDTIEERNNNLCPSDNSNNGDYLDMFLFLKQNDNNYYNMISIHKKDSSYHGYGGEKDRSDPTTNTSFSEVSINNHTINYTSGKNTSFYVAAQESMVLPEFNNSNNEMYFKNAELNISVPEKYIYSAAYENFKNTPYHYTSDELKVLYTHGGLSISTGYIYQINGQSYMPIYPPTIDVLSEQEYARLTVGYSDLKDQKQNTVLMIPVGTKGN